MSFLAALFGGQNKTLNQDIGSTGALAGFAANQGQGDTSKASSFYSTLLSGDQGQIGKLLAPQIGSIQKQSQQQKQTLGQFGNRSGGTNAEVQGIGDKSRSSVNDLVSGLTSGAAGGLAGLGTNLLSQGFSGFGQQAGLSQEQLANYQNSILGGAITSGVNAGLGALKL